MPFDGRPGSEHPDASGHFAVQGILGLDWFRKELGFSGPCVQFIRKRLAQHAKRMGWSHKYYSPVRETLNRILEEAYPGFRGREPPHCKDLQYPRGLIMGYDDDKSDWLDAGFQESLRDTLRAMFCEVADAIGAGLGSGPCASGMKLCPGINVS